ncbi:glucose-induced degradation protein 8 homolog [Glandiceps talaboti]
MSFQEKKEEVDPEEWMEKLQTLHITRADMNKLIMDYLVTEGFKEAAEKFKVESGIQPNIDLDTLDERIHIRDAIQNGRIEDAIALVNDLHPELLDNDRYLFFHLQQQHLIELIRNKKTEEALEYAQTHLAERGEENCDVLPELERSLALLAFENPEHSPFSELLHPSQRQKVASELNAAILEMESRESTPKLAKLLKLLLWSQDQLDSKKVKYPKMTDLPTGKIHPHTK